MTDGDALDKLVALLAKATPAPWIVELLEEYITGRIITAKAHTYAGNKGSRPDCVTDPNTMTAADAELIVWLRNNAADAITQLRQRVAAAEQFVRVDLTKPADYLALESALAERDRRIAELEAAVSWALGEGNSNFRARREGEGAYWWRAELQARAAKGST